MNTDPTVEPTPEPEPSEATTRSAKRQTVIVVLLGVFVVMLLMWWTSDKPHDGTGIFSITKAGAESARSNSVLVTELRGQLGIAQMERAEAINQRDQVVKLYQGGSDWANGLRLAFSAFVTNKNVYELTVSDSTVSMLFSTNRVYTQTYEWVVTPTNIIVRKPKSSAARR